MPGPSHLGFTAVRLCGALLHLDATTHHSPYHLVMAAVLTLSVKVMQLIVNEMNNHALARCSVSLEFLDVDELIGEEGSRTKFEFASKCSQHLL